MAKTQTVSMEIAGQTHTLTPPTVKGKTAAAPKEKAPKAEPQKQVYLTLQGTAKELYAQGAAINGKPLDSVALSVLAKFGAIKTAGVEAKDPKVKGKAGTIFVLTGKPGFKVEKGIVMQSKPQVVKTRQAAPVETQAIQGDRIPEGYDHAKAMGLTM